MNKRIEMPDFLINGIVQNNLKNINFSGAAGEIILISGISGSGKSTLTNEVIVAEARRQEAMRRKVDDLYVYSVRPKISAATQLPPAISVSQRALIHTELSSFGTRTGLKKVIQKLFVAQGKILYKGEQIQKPSLFEIKEFAKEYYPAAKLYAVLSNYESISCQNLLVLLKKHSINAVYSRNEKGMFRQISVSKLAKVGLSEFELLVDLDLCLNEFVVTELSRSGVLLLGENIDINFNDYYFSLSDGTIFRRPSLSLFSKSTASSLSGYCRVCSGIGRVITADISNVINEYTAIQDGFLNVPLGKSGRYIGFKFLPSGLTSVLKKQGVDTKKSFSDLMPEAKEIVIATLTDKLLSNQHDEQARRYLSETACSECNGTGYDYQASAVFLNGKPINYYLSLTADELNVQLADINLEQTLRGDIERRLMLIKKLAIDHISLDRSTTSISSGEGQRIKLLDLLISQESEKIVVLDEPSSNLQYRDNLHIIELILEIKARKNCVIIVDHNPLYRCIADRIIEVGPGAGTEGGFIDEIKYSTRENTFTFPFLDFEVKSLTNPNFKIVDLQKKHNINLSNVKFPKESVTVIVGSSGSGKTTLVLDLIYNSLLSEGAYVAKLDSKAPGKSPSSIVATYLNVFDDVRKIYAKSHSLYFSEGDFSFNSTGACIQCNGLGQDGDKPCGVCFGSRYKPNVSLVKVDDLSIVELLNSDLKLISTKGIFSFLTDALRILDALSLGHITLGRATSSLSGGELQRLKLARFILSHYKMHDANEVYVILDEPSRGLDRKATLKLHQAILHYLGHCTILVIEHNPDFIYQCDYVIDLGVARGVKTSADVEVGFSNEKSFPSLNHKNVFNELNLIVNNSVGHIAASLPVDTLLKNDVHREGKCYNFVNSLYVKQENFELESRFISDYEVVTRDENVIFYSSMNKMQLALIGKNNFLYNPFVSYLEKYVRVPKSICVEVFSTLNKSDIVCAIDPWRTLVKAESFESAFLKGAGTVATYIEGGMIDADTVTYHTIRLFSLVDQVIDQIEPASFVFNMHRNSCPYCNGYGHLKSYPFAKWINKKYSVFDEEMTPYKINKIMPKATIAKFAKEGLFDFSAVVETLSQEEFNILLYGFKAYKFKKPNKAGNVEDDFFEWRGLNSYIYHNSKKLSSNGNLHQYLDWVVCPFCCEGFRPTIERYVHKGKTFVDYLRNI